MNIDFGLIMMTVPVTVSMISLIITFNKKDKALKMLIYSIIGCLNFISSIYINMCNFSYFHAANFKSIGRGNDISYVFNMLSKGEYEAKIMLIINTFLILITIINIIYISCKLFIKKNK